MSYEPSTSERSTSEQSTSGARTPDPTALGPGSSSRVVRPYVLTQGRTRAPEATYGLEAQVRALVPAAKLAGVAAPEARRIVELAQSSTSVAELAIGLALPLGVTRVLVGDLVAVGALAVDGVTSEAGTDVALLERLLDGIRAL